MLTGEAILAAGVAAVVVDAGVDAVEALPAVSRGEDAHPAR